MSDGTHKLSVDEAQTDAGALHELAQIRFDLNLMGPAAGDTREHVKVLLRDQQRLSDLATAVHDWAQAKGYIAGKSRSIADDDEVDRELVDAWYKQVGHGTRPPIKETE